eukprot:454224-Rhodomonas_salina.1
MSGTDSASVVLRGVRCTSAAATSSSSSRYRKHPPESIALERSPGTSVRFLYLVPPCGERHACLRGYDTSGSSIWCWYQMMESGLGADMGGNSAGIFTGPTTLPRNHPTTLSRNHTPTAAISARFGPDCSYGCLLVCCVWFSHSGGRTGLAVAAYAHTVQAGYGGPRAADRYDETRLRY